MTPRDSSPPSRYSSTPVWILPVLVISFAFLGSVLPVRGAMLVSGALSDVQIGSTYDYTILLTNSGTTNVNTFWYAWIPGQDYLPTTPTNIQSPAGWVFSVTHGGSTDGYAIQWKNSTGSALTPGSSFDQFSFETTNTPTQLAGNSPFYTNTPIGTSIVYGGAPFSGTSEQFVVQSVPEPTSAGLILLGLMAFFGVRGVLAQRGRKAD